MISREETHLEVDFPDYIVISRALEYYPGDTNNLPFELHKRVDIESAAVLLEQTQGLKPQGSKYEQCKIPIFYDEVPFCVSALQNIVKKRKWPFSYFQGKRAGQYIQHARAILDNIEDLTTD